MTRPATAKASIDDIAAKCGVSKMTVSRVLRNSPNVSEATRQMVLRVAERENYLPTSYGADAASALKQYFVLFEREASLQSAFFGDVIRAIQQELFSSKRSCSLGILEDSYAEFVKLYDMLQTSNVGGLLLVGSASADTIRTLVQRFGNVVLVDNPGDPAIGMPYSAVYCENASGSHAAVDHLLKMGRRRILLITGPRTHYFSQALCDGYRTAHAGSELEPDESLTVTAAYSVTGGYEAAKMAIERGVRFDAVFSNDEMACGAMRALAEAGLNAPQHVSVVGFDGLPIGEAVTPALTTVLVDRTKMGKSAVRLLLQLEQGGSPERVSFFPKLAVRDSCGHQ